MMRGWEHNPHGWGAEQWIGPLLMVAVLVVIVVVIVLVIRSLNSRHSSPPMSAPALTSAPALSGSVGVNQAALQILEERYARGDIQREEFMQRRQDLWSPTGPPVSPQPAPPAAPPAGPPVAPPPAAPPAAQ